MSAVVLHSLSYSDRVADLSYDEKAHVVREVNRLQCAMKASLLPALAAMTADQDELHQNGHRHIVDFVQAELGFARSQAFELARVAMLSPECPQLVDAFAQGRLPWDRLCLITTGITEAHDDQWWLDHHAEMNNGQIRSLIREEKKPASQRSANLHRTLSLKCGEDGFGSIRGSMANEDLSLILTAIDRLAHEAPYDDDLGGFPSIGAARVDALIQICSQTIAKDSDADRAAVVIHAPIAALDPSRFADVMGGRIDAEMNDFLMESEAFKRRACDASYQMVYEDGRRTVGIGRKSRIVPEALRRQVKRRDRGCQFPGCDKTRWTDIHHIVFWGEGGPTDMDNLVELCVAHHHFVHDKKWKIVGNPENGPVRFLTPNNQEFRPPGCDDGPVPVEELVQKLDGAMPKDEGLLRSWLGLPRISEADWN